MFVITSVYLKPAEVIDKYLAAHREFLDRYIEKGIFFAAGRKVPRTGGLILAKGVSKEAVRKIMEEDPFSIEGISEYEVMEIELTKIAPGFESLK